MEKIKYVDSKEYWENRYSNGRNSGDGSYGNLADFKANVINKIIIDNKVKTVMELGCGDGNQLEKFKVKKYIGYDVSKTIITKCINKYKKDKSKKFVYNISDLSQSDMTLSLDVLYHLVENKIFNDYLNDLFRLSKNIVIIYTFGESAKNVNFNNHIKYRDPKYIIKTANKKGFDLIEIIENKYPYNSETRKGSYANFLIFKRK